MMPAATDCVRTRQGPRQCIAARAAAIIAYAVHNATACTVACKAGSWPNACTLHHAMHAYTLPSTAGARSPRHTHRYLFQQPLVVATALLVHIPAMLHRRQT